MQIRPLTPQDAPAFAALRLRGLQECPEAFASSYEEEVGTPIQELEVRLKPKADAAIFGAFKEADLLCALVGLQRESMVKLAHKAFIWGMYVAPEVRGRGVGTLLLEHALTYAARTLGTRQVNLGVNTRNAAAIALYKKLGFVEYGLERDFLRIGGEFHDEYQMVHHVQQPGPRVLQRDDAANVVAEVMELHAFLERWFNGALPKTTASFSRLTAAWPPTFTLIDPNNVQHSAESLLAQTYDHHRKFPALSIQIRNARVVCESGGVGVVTYEEWHADPGEVEGRLCSATFVPAPPGSAAVMLWVHVHESKLHHHEGL